jgi:preprotein translocase subunit SecG
MESVLLVIHMFLALGIIGLVLIQRSEGGGLGIGGGGGGAGNFASPRGTANILSRLTAIFAAGFFTTSLILGILAGQHTTKNTNILDDLETPASVAAPLVNEADTKTTEEKSSEPPAAPIAE